MKATDLGGKYMADMMVKEKMSFLREDDSDK